MTAGSQPSAPLFGVYVPQAGVDYDDWVRRARHLEDLGLDALWLGDHLSASAVREPPAFESWTLATALLMQTTRLRIGHLVLCSTFRHPAVLGKMATTLDVVSGGRFNFGVGSGSSEPEHQQTGIPWGRLAYRSELLEDTLEIVSRMFTGAPTTYAGKHFQVTDLPNLPPPVQQPRPPVYVGGIGERWTLPLVARFADVWNVPFRALGELRRKQAVLDAECSRIGRDPRTVRRSLEAVTVVARDEVMLARATAIAEQRYPGPQWGLHDAGLVGTPDAVVQRLGELIELGFTEFVFFPYDRDDPSVLEILASDVLPQFARSSDRRHAQTARTFVRAGADLGLVGDGSVAHDDAPVDDHVRDD
jgi:alkanesulfonate monooxygenase SsuD/methylene tetrahydromethanopterin reductase-like flavin-dependent oxidoreductase (luciferase family)